MYYYVWGLDSRLLLCELLQFTTSDKIRLFISDTRFFDYEIPSMISKNSVLNRKGSKQSAPFDKRFTQYHRTNRWTYLFDSFYNRIVFKRFGKCLLLVWILGNNLAGDNLIGILGIPGKKLVRSLLPMTSLQ